MNDEQFLLANAYLDGELTADERALAEADPDVMAGVEELRALQALVRDVDPPSDRTRDSAIAAAMAQFAPTATDADQRVVAMAPRRSYSRYLAVAAGVLGVGLLGVAVANIGTGGDDDSADDSAAMEPVAEEPAAEEPAEARITEDAPFAADDAGDMSTAEIPAEEPASEPMEAESDAVEEPAEEPASEEPADEPAEGGVAERPVLVPDQVLTTPEELGSFGTGLLEQQQAGTLPPTPNHACPIENVLGTAEYAADAASAPTTLLVAVDEPARIVLGFDEDTCELVVEGPLYLP